MSESIQSLRDDIINLMDLKAKPFMVPEWGKRVYIRTINGLERAAFTELSRNIAKNANALYKIVALGLSDANNERLFTDEEAMQFLKNKSNKALERIAIAVMQHNALRDEDYETAEKNFETAPTFE